MSMPKLRFTWIGLAAGIGYWLLESALHAFIFSPEFSFIQMLAAEHDTNEITMRIIIILLLVGMGFAFDMHAAYRQELLDHANRLNRLLKFLSDVNQIMSHQRDMQALFDAACRVAVETGEFAFAWVGLLNRETGMVELQSYAGADEPAMHAIPTDRHLPHCEIHSKAIRDGKAYICSDIDKSPCKSFCLDQQQLHGVHSVASFPLIQHGAVTGTMTVYACAVDYFKDDEMAVLSEAANDIAFTMDSIERETKLQQRLDELERFQKATVQREFRIKELGEEVKRLKAEKNEND